MAAGAFMRREGMPARREVAVRGGEGREGRREAGREGL